jgi:hypothetical protein
VASVHAVIDAASARPDDPYAATAALLSTRRAR